MGKTAGKPRGKMSAYAFFVQSCREEFRKEHPDGRVVFAEFSKTCAQRWKSIDVDDRKRFDDMAERDKVRFENDMRAFQAMPPMPEKSTKRRKKMPKDPNAPKRALSAFFLFCNDERPVVRDLYPNHSVADVAKELGRRWVLCSDRDKYEAMATQEKLRYRQELSEYRRQSWASVRQTDTERSVSAAARASLPAAQSTPLDCTSPGAGVLVELEAGGQEGEVEDEDDITSDEDDDE